MEHSTVDNSYPTRCAYLQIHTHIFRIVAMQFCVALVGDSFNRRHTVYVGLNKLLSLSTYMYVVMRTG